MRDPKAFAFAHYILSPATDWEGGGWGAAYAFLLSPEKRHLVAPCCSVTWGPSPSFHHRYRSAWDTPLCLPSTLSAPPSPATGFSSSEILYRLPTMKHSHLPLALMFVREVVHPTVYRVPVIHSNPHFRTLITTGRLG